MMGKRVFVSMLFPVLVGGLAGPAIPQEPALVANAPSAGPSLAAEAESLTVEEIVARNVAVRGGIEAWRAVHAVRLSGLMDVGQGLRVPYTLELQRPRKMRLDFLFDGEMVAQAYDGTVGWKRLPHLGRHGYEFMTEEELEAASNQAELDGPLIDYRAKGHEIALVGRAEVEGREAFELAVTLSTGAVRQLFIDAETFLEVKLEAVQTVAGSVETFYRGWQATDGLLFPRRLETRAQGRDELHALTVDSVRVNPPMDDARFARPGGLGGARASADPEPRAR